VTLVSAGISGRRVFVRLSHVGVLLKRLRRRITQTTQHDSPATLVFRCRKFRQNPKMVTPDGGAKCRWGRLNADAVAANCRLSTRSVVNLVRSQVYHTERPPCLSAACSPWYSESRWFVSDSWSWLSMMSFYSSIKFRGCVKNWVNWQHLEWLCQYLRCACAEIVGYFIDRNTFFSYFHHLSLRVCRNSGISTLGSKSAISIVILLIATLILCWRVEIVMAMWQHIGRLLFTFSARMHRTVF